MKILAVGAHPDDVEICCFGTLARCVQRGDSVVVCSVTNGNQGHAEIEPERLRLVRMAEGARAAQVIGASYTTLDVDDMVLDDTDTSLRLRFTQMIRTIKPDVIITHEIEDYHPDHVATARLVFHCLTQALLPHVRTDSPAIEKSPILYHMDKVGGGLFVPTEFVDVTETFEMKAEALICHTSQVDFLKKSSDMNLLHGIEVLAEYRGLQCGCRYAEAFRISDRKPVISYRVLP